MNVLASVLPEWVQWIQALGPLTLGVLTLFATGFSLWVSFRQSKISQDQARISGEHAKVAGEKLRFDLYEKRLQAHADFEALIQHVLITANPDRNELLSHRHAIRKHRWLFGSEVMNKLDEVILKAYEIRMHEMRINSKAAADIEPHLDQIAELMGWFTEEQTALDVLFAPYLRFERAVGRALPAPGNSPGASPHAFTQPS